MNFYIQQKVFSIGDKYAIKNEAGADVFWVKGKLISLGAKLRIFDMQDRELVFIKQELLHVMPQYTIFRNEQTVATVKKKLKFFKSHFDVESSAGKYDIDGEFFAMDFTISHNGAPAATIRKKWLSFGDSYEISVADNEDAPLLLAMVIIIDNCLHNSSDS